MVVLDPTTHVYLDADNVQYESVTRFINKFVPQFDFEGKSKKYAAKYGLDVEEVRESWRGKNKQSTDFGTLIHEQIEDRLRNKSSKCENVIESISKEIEETFEGEYLLEHTLWNVKNKIAGTSDLIINGDTTFSIVDFKTNKQIKFTNDYEEKFLLKPIDHLPNSEYFKYALQLSFYAYLYNLSTGKVPYRLCFYWLKRKNNSYEKLKDSTWTRYNVPYLKEEVEKILEYAKKS